MSNAEYIVMRRAGRWSYTINGDRFGPFQNQIAAQDAGIVEARHCGRRGERARVSFDDASSMPVIFDTESDNNSGARPFASA